MKLEEKFEEVALVYDKSLNIVKTNVSIAEEFAIGFSEWLDTLIERFGILEYRRNFMNKSKKQLLKIYKQEKGL